MLWEQKIEYAVLSDIGFRRRNNQDSYCIQIAPERELWNERGHLFLVADGMGGHAVGELASKIAADTIPHTFHKLKDMELSEALKSAVIAGHQAIHERGQQNRDFTKMGTTCTVLVLSPQGAVLGHVGDSRAYRIRNRRIEQLTFDHSLQWELLKQGKMSPEEILLNNPRNIITRSLGPQPTVQVDIEGPSPIRPRDVYLLCSDGLSGLVSDEEIGMIAGELSTADACQLLVDLANLRGGSDNCTVVIVRVGALPTGVTEVTLPERKSPNRDYGWSWLIAVFFVGIAFIFGNTLMAYKKIAEGITLESLGILVLGGLILAWLRKRRNALVHANLPETTPGTAYRSASAKITRRFVSDLGALEYNLQRTAAEEEWTIDWTQHSVHYQEAKTALGQRRYSDSLRHYARAIHCLMTGIQAQRKQRDLVTRWKVKTPPTRS